MTLIFSSFDKSDSCPQQPHLRCCCLTADLAEIVVDYPVLYAVRVEDYNCRAVNIRYYVVCVIVVLITEQASLAPMIPFPFVVVLVEFTELLCIVEIETGVAGSGIANNH